MSKSYVRVMYRDRLKDKSMNYKNKNLLNYKGFDYFIYQALVL